MNTIIPLITNSYATASLGPPTTIIMVAAIFYAIFRHKLFDIRSAVARSLGYVLTLGFFILVFIVLIFGLAGPVFGLENNVTGWQQLLYIVFSLAVAILFPYYKRFFDRITNRIFFRDSYDPQQLIDEISNLLVTHYELDKLASLVAEVIVRYMKLEFCSFYIAAATRQHLYGTKRGMTFMKADDIEQQMDAKIVLIDVNQHPDETTIETALRREVVDTGARVVVKLRSTTDRVGLMFLGPKKSGANITSGDLKVIDIISDEIALAFQNATRFEEISTFNATLQQKIEAATQELTRTNQKLKALDEAKDEFISMASHQLRTPLTSVKGYLSLVLEGDLGEITPQQRQLLSQAFSSSQRMVYLISDLLNVSRLRTGKFVIEPKEVYLPDMVEEEIRQVVETAKAKKVKLTYKKPKDFPTLKLDDNKIRQVMMNFMDNAIYYTAAGGKVAVELSATKSSVSFMVTDNGIGVPKAEQHKLFTKFYRAENARSMRPDGTGLGLFMAKKVIVASGGALIFKSTEGKGSTFGFSFPLSVTQ